MVEVRMEKVQVLSILVGREEREERKKNSYTLEAGRRKRKNK